MKQPRFALSAPVIPEHDLQKSIVRVLRLEIGPEGKVSEEGVTWFCIDHASGDWSTRVSQSGRGICPGIPDMIVLWRGNALWIEIKSRDGSVSDPQRWLAASLLLSGCRIAVACDVDDVLRALDTWMVPRKRRVRVAA